jgi:uncharacterized membrane protein
MQNSGSDTVLTSMTILDTTLVIMMTLLALVFIGILLVLLAYLLGWSFSAGYHNQKYNQTKRLVELLKEGRPTQ